LENFFNKDETVPHALELKYGLTAQELLDAIDKRFRLKVALEGAVAEVHFREETPHRQQRRLVDWL
jgi:hypothetical protein